MTTYKITFKNEEGKTKSIKVKATGICPAIEKAIRKTIVNVNFMKGFCYPIKAEEIQ